MPCFKSLLQISAKVFLAGLQPTSESNKLNEQVWPYMTEVPHETYCSCFDGVSSWRVWMSTDQCSDVDDIASVVWWLLGDVWCRQSHVSWLCPNSGCRCIRRTLWWLQRNTALLLNIIFCHNYCLTAKQLFITDVTEIHTMPHHNITFKTIPV